MSTTYAALLAASTTLLLILLPLTLWRLKTILSPAHRPKPTPSLSDGVDGGAHLLIVLGSGGHTAEMLSMLHRATTEEPRLAWTERFARRTWVVGSGDGISAERAKTFEEAREGEGDGGGVYTIRVAPRAREIHQSVYTAPMSCLRCAMACLRILTDPYVDFPDLILCNGPATATILVLTSVGLRFFDVGGCQRRGKMRTVYVESWARVRRLSLSGRVLAWVVDRFLVQWVQLDGCAGGRGEFVGVLV